MYKNILVSLDGSPMDTQIIEMGISLASQLKAKLHGLTVQDETMLEGPLMYDISGALAFIPQLNFLQETRKVLEEKAKNILSGFENTCQENDIACQGITQRGTIYKIICDQAELHDLSIIGRRGLNYQFDHELLGSTADRVVRHTKAPVLVMTHEFSPIKNPMIAYDGSHPSKKALKTAIGLCSELKWPLTVLNVSSDPSHAQEILNEAKTSLDNHPVIVKYEYEKGNPHEKVAQYAKTHKHDLVIMGARGHRGIIDFILGSTTQYTLWSGAFHVLVDR
ncbi:MAG: universal stress protein [Deltaproteobacteria bacterium]|nr:universal stress protein [Deltaproteobacteria bacterium]